MTMYDDILAQLDMSNALLYCVLVAVGILSGLVAYLIFWRSIR